MKLIAFDLQNIVLVDGDLILAYSKIGGPRMMMSNAIPNLGSRGFKIVDMEIDSIDDAWKIVLAEERKIK